MICRERMGDMQNHPTHPSQHVLHFPFHPPGVPMPFFPANRSCKTCGKPLQAGTAYLAKVKRFCNSACRTVWHQERRHAAEALAARVASGELVIMTAKGEGE